MRLVAIPRTCFINIPTSKVNWYLVALCSRAVIESLAHMAESKIAIHRKRDIFCELLRSSDFTEVWLNAHIKYNVLEGLATSIKTKVSNLHRSITNQ